MKLRLMTSVAVLSIAAVGCGSAGPGSKAIEEMESASLGTQLEVTTFASFGPLMAYQIPQSYLALAALGDEAAEGQACPTISGAGDVVRIEGGCTDGNGTTYRGSIEVRADPKNERFGTVDFKGFSMTAPSECGEAQTADLTQTFDGTFRSKGDAAGAEFSLDLTLSMDGLTGSGCAVEQQVLALVYDGTVEGPVPSMIDGEQALTLAASTWNVTGQIGVSTLGAVTVETRDEVLHIATCQEGALSGTTTLTGSKEAVLSFNGNEECGASATWTLDGVDQGELTGVTCSAMGGGSLSAFGLLAVGGLLRRRRRDPR